MRDGTRQKSCAGASINNQGRRVTIQCGIDCQMVLFIETHWNSGEAPAGEKFSEFLRCRGRWSIWIDVDHLAGAIDDHSKLRHLMRSEQAIQVRSTNFVNMTLVGDCDRHVCESAIAHH